MTTSLLFWLVSLPETNNKALLFANWQFSKRGIINWSLKSVPNNTWKLCLNSRHNINIYNFSKPKLFFLRGIAHPKDIIKVISSFRPNLAPLIAATRQTIKMQMKKLVRPRIIHGRINRSAIRDQQMSGNLFLPKRKTCHRIFQMSERRHLNRISR